MAVSVPVSAWLVGTVGGSHCLSMCGGFMAAISARDGSTDRRTAPLLPTRAIMRQQVGYHAGRIATYMLLGAVLGAAGAAGAPGRRTPADSARDVRHREHFRADLGLQSCDVRRKLDGCSVWASVFGTALLMLRPLLQRPGTVGRITLGLVWG